MALLLHPAARIAMTEFTVHSSTVIGLAAIGALYHWRAGHAPAGGRAARPAARTPTPVQRATI
jgi:hypothetical protein